MAAEPPPLPLWSSRTVWAIAAVVLAGLVLGLLVALR